MRRGGRGGPGKVGKFEHSPVAACSDCLAAIALRARSFPEEDPDGAAYIYRGADEPPARRRLSASRLLMHHRRRSSRPATRSVPWSKPTNGHHNERWHWAPEARDFLTGGCE
ncbi:hypothetical protein GCM10023170_099080 [Phytohabitans houttuyneae]